MAKEEMKQAEKPQSEKMVTVTAKVDFLSTDFGNVKQGQKLKATAAQARSLAKMALIETQG